jgi:hypothetical protein
MNTIGLLTLWSLSLAILIVWPHWTSSPTLADDEVRFTVRLALVGYAAAAALMLLGRFDALTRWLWTLAWASYLVHLAMAFHYYHHWSHIEAVAHTEAVSGFGPGIYFSHLFTVVWTADVAYWWWRPHAAAKRAPWITRALHSYMAFIVFNATVVYESGPIRWAGALMFAVLLAVWLYSNNRKARSCFSVTSP